MHGILKKTSFLLISACLSPLSPSIFGTRLPFSPAAAQTASPAEKPVKVENIVVAEPLVTFEIKSLSLFGSSLSDSDLAIIFDSKSTQLMSERLRQLSASMILIPELNIKKTGELNEFMTYRDVKLEQVAHGVAAKASAAEANFTIKDAQGDVLSGAYGKMLAEMFDMSLAAAMMTEAQGDAAGQKTLLYKTFRVEGFTCANPKSEFALSVNEMNGQDVKARPLRQPLPEPAKDGRADQPERRLSEYLAMVRDGFDIGDAQTEGVHTTIRNGEKSITLVLDGLQVHDLMSGRIAEADIKSLDFLASDTSVKLKDLAIGGIDLRALGGTIMDEQSTADAEGSVHPPIFLWAANSLKLTGLQVVFLPDLDPDHTAQGAEKAEIPKLEGSASGVLAQAGFSLEQAETKYSPMKDGEPDHFTASFTHLNADLRLTQTGFTNALANLGYSTLDLSGSVALSVNAAKELNVSNFALSGIDIGKFKGSLIAGNVTGDVLSPDPAIAEKAWHAAVFKHLDLHVDNFGLLSKVIAHQAEVQNKTISETRDSYVTAASMIVPVLLGGGPSSKEIGNAVAKFIADPKSFHLIANTSKGLSLADPSLFQDPATLLKKLDIKVETGP